MKKKIKSNMDLAKEIRGTWSINPVTRVHDNEIKKNNKKLRRQGRKICRKGLESMDSSPSYYFCLTQEPGITAFRLLYH